MKSAQKILLPLLICVFILISCPARPNTLTKITTKQIDSLNRLALKYGDTSFNASYRMATLAIQLSKAINYSDGEAEACLTLGGNVFGKHQYVNAITYYYNAISLSRNKNPDIFARANIAISKIFSSISRYEIAESYYDVAAAETGKISDTLTLILLHIRASDIQIEKKEFSKAATNLYYALYLAICSKDTSEWNIYQNIGTLYLKQQNYSKAIYFFKKSILAEEQIQYKYGFGSTYTLLAMAFQEIHDQKKAAMYHHMAISIRKSQGLMDLYYSSLINAGNFYLSLNNLDSAEYYLTKVIQLISGSKNDNLIAYGFLKQKELFIKQKKYKEACIAYDNYLAAQTRHDTEKNRGKIDFIEATNRFKDLENKKLILDRENQLQKVELALKNKTSIIHITLAVTAIIIALIFLIMYFRSRHFQKMLEMANRNLHQEIVERMEAEEKLRTSEASYRFLAENTLDLIIHMDANMKVLYISPNCEEFLGYSPGEFNTEFYPFLIIHPEYQEMMKEQYLGMKHKLQPNLVCYEAVRKDGSKFWVESLSNPIIDQATSMFAGSLTVIRNIEERVKYEEQLFENTRQKEILLREIHHRVKNNFALLFSILTLQRYSTNNSEMKELIEELQLRIRAMSSIHDLLYRNDDLADIPFDIYAIQLVNIVVAAFRNKPIHVHHNMDTCILDIKIALPLGLIVNELVTNSFKYAFTENGEGILTIGLHLYEPGTEYSPEKWKLTVRDNGKGLPEEYAAKTSHTLGTQIIKMLVAQIEGEIKASSNEGACFDIIFPQQID